MGGKLDQYRERVVEGVRDLLAKGLLFQETGGNVSVRIPSVGGMAITPSQTPYPSMEPEDVCILGPNLEPLEDNGKKPSIEAGMHLRVYQKRPDAHAVVHTHQKFTSIFALIAKPIPALFDEVSLFIGNRIEIVPYGFSGSQQLMENLTPLLDNRANCYILQNHGALAMGPDMDKAVRNAALLEKSAEIYYRALATGSPVSELPQDTQDLLKALLAEDQKNAAVLAESGSH